MTMSLNVGSVWISCAGNGLLWDVTLGRKSVLDRFFVYVFAKWE